MAFDSNTIRQEFPIFTKDPTLVYLDNAATTQKPKAVLDAMQDFFETENANVHRGMHNLAETATVSYEAARSTVQTFLSAASPEEIIFTKGTTESLNLVARSYGETFLKKGDTVILSILEHHSNIVPWLQLKEKIGINIAWLECNEMGVVDLSAFTKLLQEEKSVKLVSLAAQSNVFGTRPPLKEIIQESHKAGAVVVVDAAQAVAHMPIDVVDLDCDFLAFSGHKLYGPTGIGVLYGKKKLLEKMPAFLGGGMMIAEVTKNGFTPADLPQKFEAGTPAIAEAIGLAAAIDWFLKFPWEEKRNHEKELLLYALEKISLIKGVKILGPCDAEKISGCISFTIEGIHPHDLTDLLGKAHICLRAGHHCTQPLHDFLSLKATSRLSVGIYSTKEEIDVAVGKMEEILSKFQA